MLICLTVYILLSKYVFSLVEYPVDYSNKLCEKLNEKKENKYDFIIVGAGSAGCALASRLSEELDFKVLLIERGNDPDSSTETPILWANLLKSSIDYQYTSELDDKLFKGLENQVSHIPKGKVSGGSSGINVGMYIRGHKKDFDDWYANGCLDWNYENVKPYFLKSEDYQGKQDYNRNIHNIGGPLTVTPYYSPDPAIAVFRDALKSMRVDELDDLNGYKAVGFGYSDSTTRHGLRCSSFKAYISRTKLRRNFFFARNVLVGKIIFNKRKKAVGVEVTTSCGKKCIVNTRKEIILTSGAIASPQILMLSGIGPKEVLNELNIPMIVEAPVGKNYHDHPVFVGLVFSDNEDRPLQQVYNHSKRLINDTLALINRGISTMGLTKLVAFLNTKNDNGLYPDIQLMTMRISYATMMETWNKKHKLFNMFGLSQKTAHLFTEINNTADCIFVLVILTNSKSKGYMRLRSTNIEDSPKIFPKFLTDDDDTAALLRGVRFVETLAQTSHFKNAKYKLKYIDYPSCAAFKKSSDDYWRCAFRQIVSGFYHPGGTCKMGAENDSTAVLNPQLKVKGVKNLRVVDTSAMPQIVSVNPNAATIMMAEKIADQIKEEYHKITNYFRDLL